MALKRISLPGHLEARVFLPAGERPLHAEGAFILYWVRGAWRAHENPALDVALTAGRALGLPVLVHGSIDARSRWASDRHHRFLLEAARDLEEELEARGIAWALHVERGERAGEGVLPLHPLAAEAALVVTDDVPVAEYEEALAELTRATTAPVLAVDSACLVPFRSVPRAVSDRAFRFRQATEGARAAAFREKWAPVEVPPGGEALSAHLPFEPVALAHVDLDALVALCPIDHGVAPVPHTIGGSNAGYARWSAFRDGGLRAYHRTRNDALRDGVSRMSAWLHHGMVSPFRIAREARDVGGEGAEKFLDELLVWRELSYAFCAHHPERDRVEVLPAWARETLRAHEGDPRPFRPTGEALIRGRTGDRLWDAAQRSLLIHGELHNNVRMTWGKALVAWSENAEEALRRLIDLNHRYALDGNDPSSYGGLLWCLGALDRPFDPEIPVLGTVRPRPTSEHARRLDPAAYAARTGRPAHPRLPRVAVIGAGISGLACARTLSDHGAHVDLFDKGRRPGGRISTREQRGASSAGSGIVAQWDHGAQFLTARDPSFRRWVEVWEAEGVLARWEGRMVRISQGDVAPAREGPRWVGVPGMQALAAHLAVGLNVHCGIRVDGIERRADGWWMSGIRVGEPEAEPWEAGPYGAIVVAVPPAQAAPLLAPGAPELASRVEGADMLPCWAGLIELAPAAEEGAVELPWDAAWLDHPVLAWVARDGSKPGRPSRDSWVLHASPEWSRANIEAEVSDAAEALATAFREVTGRSVDPSSVRMHRWRYALPAEAMGERALWDAGHGLGFCGDACLGGRVEGAFLSGVALAGRILAPGAQGADPPPSQKAAQGELFGRRVWQGRGGPRVTGQVE